MEDTTTRRRPVVDQIFGSNKAPLDEVLPVDFADLIRAVDEAEAMAKEANTKPKNDAEQAALGAKLTDLRALFKRIDGVREVEKKPVLDAGRGIDGWFGALKTRIEDAAKPLTAGADAYVRQKAAEERERARREAEEAQRRADEERAKAEAAKTAAGAARAEGRAELYDAKAEQAAAVANASAAELTRAKIGGVTSSAREVYVARIDDYNAAIAPLGAVGPYLKAEHLEAALSSMVRVQKDNAKWPGVVFFKDMRAQFRK